MKNYFLIVLFSVLSLISARHTYATDVYLAQIDGLHQADKNGAYDRILALALKSNTNPVKFILTDPDKAYASFENCNDCCISPANASDNFYNWKGDIKELAAFNYAKVYAFSKPGTTPPSKIEDLKGKQVGMRIGLPYGHNIENAGLNLVGSKTIEDNIKQLQSGEIDLFIAYVPDAYTAFNALGLEPFPNDEAHPLSVHPDRLICRGAPTQFTDTVDGSLNMLRNSGFMRKILGPNYVKPM